MALTGNIQQEALVLKVALEVARLLERMNREENIEAGIAAMALCKAVRSLLNKYPKETQTALLEAIVPYLMQTPVQLEDDPVGRLITLH